MSAFDPVAFMNQQHTEGADTRVPLHKAGDWSGMIGAGEKDIALNVRQVKDDSGNEVDTLVADFWLYADSPDAVGEGGIAPARVRLSAFLDTVPGNINSLDFGKGKNRQLGYVLTALGYQTKEGSVIKPWSWAMLKGGRLKYSVEHKPRKDNQELEARVSRVAALV